MIGREFGDVEGVACGVLVCRKVSFVGVVIDALNDLEMSFTFLHKIAFSLLRELLLANVYPKKIIKVKDHWTWYFLTLVAWR